MSPTHSVSYLLEQWNKDDPDAVDTLMSAVYEELRKMARRYLRRRVK